MLNYIIAVIAVCALVSTFILNFINKYSNHSNSERKKYENYESDQDSVSTSSMPNTIWAKRDSSRRKAVYKRNNVLNDFLEKNLGVADNGNECTLSSQQNQLQFQSNFPWKSYVQKSRYANKIQSLTQPQLQLYESIFEIILTEKSYLLQLETLTTFAESHPELSLALSKYDQNLLFGNIRQLYCTANRLYADFELLFQSDIFMTTIFGTLFKYLTDGSFEPYIEYIKGHQERQRLISDDAHCQSVPDLAKLRSLIIVPMQRITRYPLLVQSVRKICEKIISNSTNEKHNWFKSTISLPPMAEIERCHESASRFAAKCNKALDDERKLFDLIQFKKQLSGGASIDELVARDREILLKYAVKLYFLRSNTENGTANGNPTASACSIGGGGVVSLHSLPIIAAKSGSMAMFKSYSSSLNKIKSTLVLLTDMIILTEYKPKKNQYMVIDHATLDRVQLERNHHRLNSMSLGEANGVQDTSSTESLVEKIPANVEHDPSSAAAVNNNTKARCTLTVANDNVYGITFATPDEEEKFADLLRKLKDKYHQRPRQNSTTPVANNAK